MPTKTAQNESGWLRARSRRARRVRSRRPDDEELPGWQDLSEDEPDDGGDADERSGVSTIRFALVVVALAAGVALYVGHVHATKAVRADLQEARAENRRLRQELRQLKSEYAQRTAPSVIYERARDLGLRESPAYGPNINIKKSESKVENRE
jgi:uncharacterized protein HemX